MAIKIFVDQGHSPVSNAGASYGGLNEEDITYKVSAYLVDMLRDDPRFEVRVTRSSPTEVIGTNASTSLRERVQMANSWPADYFVSIHCNANVNPSVNGTEVYVYQEGSEAYTLAQYILDAIVARVGTKDNGVRVNPSLYVLRRTQMPSVLVELAYLSNASDLQKLRDNQYEFAQGIYDGLLAYFGFRPM